MLEAFRLEVAHISLSINCDDGSQADLTGNGVRYYPKSNEFVQLRTQVTNMMRTCFPEFPCIHSNKEHAAYPVVFTIDYEANPSENLVYEGVLTDLPVGELQSGETREIVTSLCFLACGRFEILVKARSLSTLEADGRVARTHIIAIVKEDM